jgi:hypothetical protein
MRGRHAAMFSKDLFSGFMRCGTCGGSVTAGDQTLGAGGCHVDEPRRRDRPFRALDVLGPIAAVRSKKVGWVRFA